MSRYTISVPEEKLLTLQLKLAQTTFPDELENPNPNTTNPNTTPHGPPLQKIQHLHHIWSTTFSWRKIETHLNQLPNHSLPIPVSSFGTLRIHFLHARSPSANAIPLLFIHGWPGSYLEVSKLLPELISGDEKKGIAFHIIAPSLPNFGWSSGVSRRGFGLAQYAETCHRLMLALGYERYVTQGGDWGMMISRTMGLLFPGSCVASHINLIRAAKPSIFQHPWLAVRNALTPYTEAERAGLRRREWFLREGAGYRDLQATRPQTLGYGLVDSPVGLLAWVYEKLVDWTDGYEWGDEEVLMWVSMYYFSEAGPAASLRIYYEAVNPPTPSLSQQPGLSPSTALFVPRSRTEEYIPHVKLGLMHNPKEITVTPKIWARTLGPVVFESWKARGGHFAAWEIPEEVVKDLFAMFGKGGKCYQIIETETKKKDVEKAKL